MSKLTFVPMKDMTSIAQGKQAVLRDGQRVGFVLKRDGGWDAYVAGRPEMMGHGTSREKAFADAERRLRVEADPSDPQEA